MLLVLILVSGPNILYACPNCKEGFDASSAQANIGGAYSLTIVFMLLVPIAIITTVVLKIRSQIKRKERLI